MILYHSFSGQNNIFLIYSFWTDFWFFILLFLVKTIYSWFIPSELTFDSLSFFFWSKQYIPDLFLLNWLLILYPSFSGQNNIFLIYSFWTDFWFFIILFLVKTIYSWFIPSELTFDSLSFFFWSKQYIPDLFLLNWLLILYPSFSGQNNIFLIYSFWTDFWFFIILFLVKTIYSWFIPSELTFDSLSFFFWSKQYIPDLFLLNWLLILYHSFSGQNNIFLIYSFWTDFWFFILLFLVKTIYSWFIPSELTFDSLSFFFWSKQYIPDLFLLNWLLILYPSFSGQNNIFLIYSFWTDFWFFIILFLVKTIYSWFIPSELTFDSLSFFFWSKQYIPDLFLLNWLLILYHSFSGQNNIFLIYSFWTDFWFFIIFSGQNNIFLIYSFWTDFWFFILLFLVKTIYSWFILLNWLLILYHFFWSKQYIPDLFLLNWLLILYPSFSGQNNIFLIYSFWTDFWFFIILFLVKTIYSWFIPSELTFDYLSFFFWSKQYIPDLFLLNWLLILYHSFSGQNNIFLIYSFWTDFWFFILLFLVKTIYSWFIPSELTFGQNNIFLIYSFWTDFWFFIILFLVKTIYSWFIPSELTFDSLSFFFWSKQYIPDLFLLILYWLLILYHSFSGQNNIFLIYSFWTDFWFFIILFLVKTIYSWFIPSELTFDSLSFFFWSKQYIPDLFLLNWLLILYPSFSGQNNIFLIYSFWTDFWFFILLFLVKTIYSWFIPSELTFDSLSFFFWSKQYIPDLFLLNWLLILYHSFSGQNNIFLIYSFWTDFWFFIILFLVKTIYSWFIPSELTFDSLSFFFWSKQYIPDLFLLNWHLILYPSFSGQNNIFLIYSFWTDFWFFIILFLVKTIYSWFIPSELTFDSLSFFFWSKQYIPDLFLLNWLLILYHSFSGQNNIFDLFLLNSLILYHSFSGQNNIFLIYSFWTDFWFFILLFLVKTIIPDLFLLNWLLILYHSFSGQNNIFLIYSFWTDFWFFILLFLVKTIYSWFIPSELTFDSLSFFFWSKQYIPDLFLLNWLLILYHSFSGQNNIFLIYSFWTDFWFFILLFLVKTIYSWFIPSELTFDSLSFFFWSKQYIPDLFLLNWLLILYPSFSGQNNIFLIYSFWTDFWFFIILFLVKTIYSWFIPSELTFDSLSFFFWSKQYIPDLFLLNWLLILYPSFSGQNNIFLIYSFWTDFWFFIILFLVKTIYSWFIPSELTFDSLSFFFWSKQYIPDLFLLNWLLILYHSFSGQNNIFDLFFWTDFWFFSFSGQNNIFLIYSFWTDFWFFILLFLVKTIYSWFIPSELTFDSLSFFFWSKQYIPDLFLLNWLLILYPSFSGQNNIFLIYSFWTDFWFFILLFLVKTIYSWFIPSELTFDSLSFFFWSKQYIPDLFLLNWLLILYPSFSGQNNIFLIYSFWTDFWFFILLFLVKTIYSWFIPSELTFDSLSFFFWSKQYIPDLFLLNWLLILYHSFSGQNNIFLIYSFWTDFWFFILLFLVKTIYSWFIPSELTFDSLSFFFWSKQYIPDLFLLNWLLILYPSFSGQNNIFLIYSFWTDFWFFILLFLVKTIYSWFIPSELTFDSLSFFFWSKQYIPDLFLLNWLLILYHSFSGQNNIFLIYSFWTDFWFFIILFLVKTIYSWFIPSELTFDSLSFFFWSKQYIPDLFLLLILYHSFSGQNNIFLIYSFWTDFWFFIILFLVKTIYSWFIPSELTFDSLSFFFWSKQYIPDLFLLNWLLILYHSFSGQNNIFLIYSFWTDFWFFILLFLVKTIYSWFIPSELTFDSLSFFFWSKQYIPDLFLLNWLLILYPSFSGQNNIFPDLFLLNWLLILYPSFSGQNNIFLIYSFWTDFWFFILLFLVKTIYSWFIPSELTFDSLSFFFWSKQYIPDLFLLNWLLILYHSFSGQNNIFLIYSFWTDFWFFILLFLVKTIYSWFIPSELTFDSLSFFFWSKQYIPDLFLLNWLLILYPSFSGQNNIFLIYSFWTDFWFFILLFLVKTIYSWFIPSELTFDSLSFFFWSKQYIPDLFLLNWLLILYHSFSGQNNIFLIYSFWTDFWFFIILFLVKTIYSWFIPSELTFDSLSFFFWSKQYIPDLFLLNWLLILYHSFSGQNNIFLIYSFWTDFWFFILLFLVKTIYSWFIPSELTFDSLSFFFWSKQYIPDLFLLNWLLILYHSFSGQNNIFLIYSFWTDFWFFILLFLVKTIYSWFIPSELTFYNVLLTFFYNPLWVIHIFMINKFYWLIYRVILDRILETMKLS